MGKFLTFLTSIGVFFSSLVRAEATVSSSQPLVVILLGPPGAGKGTQAVDLSKKLQLPHISTGDLFRENLSKNTELGKKAKTFMEKGQLVPDDIVLDMLFERISQKDCLGGYILDGFPRTLEQAKALDNRLKNKVKLLTLNLEIPDSELVDRISSRLVCKNCSAPFNKKFLPPKTPNVCDHCKGELYQRKDDTPEVVLERLKVYHKQTEPLISYYKNSSKSFFDVHSTESKEKVFQNILNAIEKGRA